MHKHKVTSLVILSLMILSLIILTACESKKETVPKPELEGTWIGLGRVMISNEYLTQREIAFMVNIEKSGKVTGYVGDAEMSRSKLQKSAWWLALLGKGKYSVTFKLGGSIVARESFNRDGGTIIFDGFKDEELLAHFLSTGNQVSTSNLELEVRDIRLSHPRQ
jgi:hypothetical protein